MCELIFQLDRVCFKKEHQTYRVYEGDVIQLGLTLTRRLPTPFTVPIEYNDQSAKVGKIFVTFVAICV